MKAKIPALAAFLLILTGCSLYRAPEPVAMKVPARFKYELKQPVSPIKDKWWENFNNPQLNGLVEEALKNNLNYKIAVKNIQVARTYVAQSRTALLPQANVSFSAVSNRQFVGRSNSSFIYNQYQAGLNASYELDVWHRLANSARQAKMNAAVSAEEAGVVKLSLLSSVCQTYFQLETLAENRENLNEQYRAAAEMLKLYKYRYENGIIDLVPVENTKVLLEQTKTALTNLAKQEEIDRNALAYYLGAFPEDFHVSVKSGRGFKETDYEKLIPPNLPAGILLRRPDIKAALYQVYASSYAEKESFANLFPGFFLTGSFGFASTDLSDFISNAGKLWNFGLDILAPLFNYQGNKSQYERAKIQYQQAVLNYRNTVLNAFTETDNALAGYKRDFEALSTYENNYRSAEKIFNLYAAQYRAGMADYPTCLNYKLNLLNARYNLANQNLLLQEDIIAIYNALGIGLKG